RRRARLLCEKAARPTSPPRTISPRKEERMPIVNRIADLHSDITDWRRDIHAHPELLYEVHRTAGLVAENLKDFGCDEVVTGLGRTGVVGVIRGARPGSTRAIGL